MGLHTPMYDMHLALGAKMIDFHGWEMPLHYGSQVEEHHQVRNDCGVFDASHMSTTDIQGPDAEALLLRVLSNNVGLLQQTGAGHYSALLNEQGGVIDDLIVFRMPDGFRLINNAFTREAVQGWLQQQAAGLTVTIRQRDDLAHFAIQGPNAIERLGNVLNSGQIQIIGNLAPYHGQCDGNRFLCRTGYTGEEGIEILLPAVEAVDFFNELIGSGITPIGLGARDTLRLEAGFTLFGNDMDEQHSPYTANMHHVVAMEPADRDFIGRSALQRQLDEGIPEKLVGLVLEERGVLRHGQPVRIEGVGEGTITSGSFSPTLAKAIALARVPVNTAERGEVEIRGRWFPVRIVRPRFVRHGKILI
ncbi:MAG: glycine cleavage system aminomethyltransferase GcvT [Gammaproteobacteria bacterium]|nr:glycine cleavage system aminomethyltransferase GcvT [Gammaproteobacteria bacterium]